MNWLNALSLHRKTNRACVLVMVTEVEGSAPRPVGARMLVSADEFYDTLGGGALELEAISHARALLENAGDSPLISNRTLVLGSALSQCCGGRVTLQFDLHKANDHILHVFGAGHVAQEVARIAQRLPGVTTFYDSRADWLNRLTCALTKNESIDMAPSVDLSVSSNTFTTIPGNLPASAIHLKHLTNNVYAAVEACEPGASFLVMTHSHELDMEVVEAILSRQDSAYCGLIASDSKAIKFRNRLRRKGFNDKELAQLTAPIGVQRKTGNTPMEVAVAAISDVLYAWQSTSTSSSAQSISPIHT